MSTRFEFSIIESVEKAIKGSDFPDHLKINKSIRKNLKKMVEAITRQSVYGAQPRSLNINWMKYDVSKENLQPNTQQAATQHTSPLR